MIRGSLVGCGIALDLFELCQDYPATQAFEHAKSLHLLEPGPAFPAFPQIDGVATHTRQFAIIGGGQAQLCPVRRQTRSAESVLSIQSLRFIGSSCAFTANLSQLLLKRSNFTSQFCDEASVLCVGFLQALCFRPNFLACYASDFSLE